MALDLSKGKSANMLKDIATKSSEESGKKTTRNIDISLIDKSVDNERIFDMGKRDRLTNAIERNGFQGTVQVYLNKEGRYTLLSGHRRFESAKELGFKEIPCEIIEEPSDSQKAEILIMSNIVARDLTPVEKGRAIKYYEQNVLDKEHFKGDKRAELGKRFGIASSQVYKFKAIADLIRPLQNLIEQGDISYANIYLCASLDEEVQNRIYEEIVDRIGLNGSILGREVEYIVRRYLKPVVQENPNSETENPNETIVDENETVDESMFETNEENNDTPVKFTEANTSPLMNMRQIDASFESTKGNRVVSNKTSYVELQIQVNARNLYQRINTDTWVNNVTSEDTIEELVKLRNRLNELNF